VKPRDHSRGIGLNTITVTRLSSIRSGAVNIGTLGYGFNALAFNDTPKMVLDVSTQNLKDRNVEGNSYGDYELIEKTSKSFSEFSGNLQFEFNVGPLISASAKAAYSRIRKEDSKVISLFFEAHVVNKTRHFAIGDLTSDDLDALDPPTHLCTKINLGRNISAMVRLTQKGSEKKSRSELETDIKIFWTRVQGDLSSEVERVEREYDIKVTMTSSTEENIFILRSFEEVNEYIDKYKQNTEATDKIVSCEYTPLTNHPGFAEALQPGAKHAKTHDKELRQINADMRIYLLYLSNLHTDALNSAHALDEESVKEIQIVYKYTDLLNEKIKRMQIEVWQEGFYNNSSMTPEDDDYYFAKRDEYNVFTEKVKRTLNDEVAQAVKALEKLVNGSTLLLPPYLNTPRPETTDGFYAIKSWNDLYLSASGSGSRGFRANQQAPNLDGNKEAITKCCIKTDSSGKITMQFGTFFIRSGRRGNNDLFAREKLIDSSSFYLRKIVKKGEHEGEYLIEADEGEERYMIADDNTAVHLRKPKLTKQYYWKIEPHPK